MKSVLLFACMAVVALAAIATGIEAGSKSKKPKSNEAMMVAAEDLQWASVPEAPDMSEAVVWGDPANGAYAAFDRFKAGLEVPLHTHSSATRGVVIAGTLEITFEGQQPKRLGPGSYASIPGKMKHTTRCVSDQDCLVFIEQPGKSDVQMVGATAQGE